MGIRKHSTLWQTGGLIKGDIIKSNTAGYFTIEADNGFNEVVVKFLDTGSVVTTTRYSARRGAVRDPYKPTVEDVGYLGQGEYKTRHLDGTKTKEYTTWRSMLRRCYAKGENVNNKSYKGKVIVCNEWFNYQVYAEWFHNNYVEGWELDKDFLNPDAMEYSPDNCVFLPPRLNKAISNDRIVGSKGLPKGVATLTRSKKFAARLNKEQERVYLGCFETPEDAGKAYRKAKNEYLFEIFEPYKDTLDVRVFIKLKELYSN